MKSLCLDYRHINALNSYCDLLPYVGISVGHIVVDVVGDAVTYGWTFGWTLCC